MSMTRVSKRNPCPVCKKFDWCLIGKDVLICMRVQSVRSKTFTDGSVGWVHPLDGSKIQVLTSKRQRKVDVNIPAIWRHWDSITQIAELESDARELGVSLDSLLMLGCARRDRNTLAFPMKDENGYVVGIRLRTRQGGKFAVEGSHQGLFYPNQLDPSLVLIVEGPTDTAACLTLEVPAIGRPSCNGGVTQLLALIKKRKIGRAVIIADTDVDAETVDGKIVNPGVDGAMRLSEQCGIPHCVLTMTVKDMRQFVNLGGTKVVLDSMIRQQIWRTK